MKISLLNRRILIKKAHRTEDELDGTINLYTDFHSCYAYISKESPYEQTASGGTWDSGKIDFTIRYYKKLDALNIEEFRVIFRDEIYQIEGIDHMNYKNKSLKLHCKKIGDYNE